MTSLDIRVLRYRSYTHTYTLYIYHIKSVFYKYICTHRLVIALCYFVRLSRLCDILVIRAVFDANNQGVYMKHCKTETRDAAEFTLERVYGNSRHFVRTVSFLKLVVIASYRKKEIKRKKKTRNEMVRIRC